MHRRRLSPPTRRPRPAPTVQLREKLVYTNEASSEKQN